MHDEPTGATDEDADGHLMPATEATPVHGGRDDEAVPEGGDDLQDEVADEAGASPADEIVDLPWDDDLPVALGEEVEVVSDADAAAPDEGDARDPDGVDGDDAFLDQYRASQRNALPRQVEAWRRRSASGAIATAIAMGLQQVFEPEKRKPAAVAEAPSDPYDDDAPVTVDYVPDDAESTTVHVKPWLLQKGDSA